MRKARPAIVAILCGVPLAFAAAGSLDAPVEHKITNRSEIARGSNASMQCFLDRLEEGWVGYESCIDDVEAAEVRQNTVTDPFRLGLYLTSSIQLKIMGDRDPSPRVAASVAKSLEFYRTESAKIENSLKISPADACQATEMKVEACLSANSAP